MVGQKEAKIEPHLIGSNHSYTWCQRHRHWLGYTRKPQDSICLQPQLLNLLPIHESCKIIAIHIILIPLYTGKPQVTFNTSKLFSSSSKVHQEKLPKTLKRAFRQTLLELDKNFSQDKYLHTLLAPTLGKTLWEMSLVSRIGFEYNNFQWNARYEIEVVIQPVLCRGRKLAMWAVAWNQFYTLV